MGRELLSACRRQVHCLGLLMVLVLALGGAARAADLDESILGSIPIQDQGRVKPLDSFARESVLLVTGKERFEGRRAMDVLLSWLRDERGAQGLKVVDVAHLGLRQALGVAQDPRWLSVAELEANPRWLALMNDIREKLDAGVELSPLEKQAARVSGRLQVLKGIASGDALAMVPNPAGPQEAWFSLGQLSRSAGEGREAHPTLPAEVAAAVPRLRSDVQGVLRSWERGDTVTFVQACATLKQDLAAVAPASVPPDAVLQRELRYNALDPFGKSWMLYLGALLALVAASAGRRREGRFRVLRAAGLVLAVGGIALHAYGFFLRCLISGRAPVTNMYESVVWVSLGVVLFALVLEALHPRGSILMAACLVSVVCLILAGNCNLLDPAINPLMPVLRNNFWLTTHVLTITLGYAAFLLAFSMGHVLLWSHAFRPREQARRTVLHHQMYRSLQVGVLLLALGTLLGGVWASYSWGRFWGWDPKEVWALIALLGYLALMHGRSAGWWGDLGMAVGSIVGFLGVLMAWYGVNYVLGAGLHRYGSGEGGEGSVAVAVAADLGVVAFLSIRAHRAGTAGEVVADTGEASPTPAPENE